MAAILFSGANGENAFEIIFEFGPVILESMVFIILFLFLAFAIQLF